MKARVRRSGDTLRRLLFVRYAHCGATQRAARNDSYVKSTKNAATCRVSRLLKWCHQPGAEKLQAHQISRPFISETLIRDRQIETKQLLPVLMIIGYGFGDEHVNQVHVDAREDNPSLGIFFVHPDGRDAIHRGVRAQDRVVPAEYVPPLGFLACIGESRCARS